MREISVARTYNTPVNPSDSSPTVPLLDLRRQLSITSHLWKVVGVLTRDLIYEGVGLLTSGSTVPLLLKYPLTLGLHGPARRGSKEWVSVTH